MQRSFLAPLCLCLGLLPLFGCEPQAPPEDPAVPAVPTPGEDPPRAVGSVTLELSGALSFVPEGAPHGAFELSSPILPRTDVLYPIEGPNYPMTAAGEADAAHRAALTYDYLLRACASLYPAIHLPARPGADLTAAEREANYGAVARCSYERYTAKPYWIPLLVDHVDLCGTELGPDWHLVSRGDLLSLGEGDLRRIADKLAAVNEASGGDFFGGYYFSLQTYLRDPSGSLAIGDFAPGAAVRVSPFPRSGEKLKDHFENFPNPISLRCIRRAP